MPMNRLNALARRFAISQLRPRISFLSTAVLEKQQGDVIPPNKKHFTSEDILRTLADSFPFDNLAAPDPHARIVKTKDEFEYKGERAVDYISKTHPEFFTMSTWIDNSLPAFDQYSPTAGSVLGVINDCLRIHQYKEVENILNNLKENQSELSEKDIAKLFAKIYYIKLNKNVPNLKEAREIMENISYQLQDITKNDWWGYKYLHKQMISHQPEPSKLKPDLQNIKDIDVINVLMEAGRGKDFPDIVIHVQETKIKPNLAFYNGLILYGSNSFNIYHLIKNYSTYLFEMNVLGIKPSAETWIAMLMSICTRTEGDNDLQKELLQNLKASLAENQTKIHYNKTWYLLTRFLHEWENYDDVKFIFKGLLPELSKKANTLQKPFYMKSYMTRVFKSGTVEEIWEVINKFILTGIIQLKVSDANLYEYLVNAALREKQYNFLPIVYSIAMICNCHLSPKIATVWGNAALQIFDQCDVETRQQFVAIAMFQLNTQQLKKSMGMPLYSKMSDMSFINQYLKILLKSQDTTSLFGILKYLTQDSFVIDHAIINDCKAIAKETGNDNFVLFLQQMYATNKQIAF